MKQKEILLWTLAVSALILSVIATFGSRLQGLSSEAASRPQNMTMSQNQGTLRVTTGGIVTNGDENSPTAPGCDYSEVSISMTYSEDTQTRNDNIERAFFELQARCGQTSSCSGLANTIDELNEQMSGQNTISEESRQAGQTWLNDMTAAFRQWCGGHNSGANSDGGDPEACNRGGGTTCLEPGAVLN